MNEKEIKALGNMYSLVAQMNSCVARIEAMKSFNQYRISCDCSPGYCENDFFKQSETLDKIAEDLKWVL